MPCVTWAKHNGPSHLKFIHHLTNNSPYRRKSEQVGDNKYHNTEAQLFEYVKDMMADPIAWNKKEAQQKWGFTRGG
jgi:hypothetical protein